MRVTEEQAQKLAASLGTQLPAAVQSTDPRARANKRIAAAGRQNGRNPQAELTLLARRRWGDDVAADYAGAVPGRKFEIDIALLTPRIAIEVDGWSYHGRFKRGFQRDREKTRLLTLNGWCVFPISAGDVMRDPFGPLELVEDLIAERYRAMPGLLANRVEQSG